MDIERLLIPDNLSDAGVIYGGAVLVGMLALGLAKEHRAKRLNNQIGSYLEDAPESIKNYFRGERSSMDISEEDVERLLPYFKKVEHMHVKAILDYKNIRRMVELRNNGRFQEYLEREVDGEKSASV